MEIGDGNGNGGEKNESGKVVSKPERRVVGNRGTRMSSQKRSWARGRWKRGWIMEK